MEHQVFHRKIQSENARIFKITKPPHFGHTWYLKDYIRNLIWCNVALEDDYRLEGIIQQPDGLSIVISQLLVVGRSPTREQLEEWFHLQGCREVSLNKWLYPNGRLVSDAHVGNFILTSEGDIVPIDLHIERLGETDML